MLTVAQICSRIEEIRRNNGYTQARLAEALHLTQPAISRYLKDRIPPAETLLELARIGNTTMEWILTGKKNYYYNDETLQVNDQVSSYDADLVLVKKIAGLPTDVRNAVFTLIDALES